MDEKRLSEIEEQVEAVDWEGRRARLEKRVNAQIHTLAELYAIEAIDALAEAQATIRRQEEELAQKREMATRLKSQHAELERLRADAKRLDEPKNYDWGIEHKHYGHVITYPEKQARAWVSQYPNLYWLVKRPAAWTREDAAQDAPAKEGQE